MAKWDFRIEYLAGQRLIKTILLVVSKVTNSIALQLLKLLRLMCDQSGFDPYRL